MYNWLTQRHEGKEGRNLCPHSSYNGGLGQKQEPRACLPFFGIFFSITEHSVKLNDIIGSWCVKGGGVDI